LEKSEREFEIDTRRKRIERERGSRERKRSGAVALRSPPFAARERGLRVVRSRGVKREERLE
jgi:hypothetical protein